MSDYIKKNKNYVTSTKLKAFAKCQFCYECEYIKKIPNPRAKAQDYFTVGKAFDMIAETSGTLTHYEKMYQVIRRGSKAYDEAVARGIICITDTMDNQIRQLTNEYLANPLFIKQIKKEVVKFEFGGLKIRCELDHCDKKEKIIWDLKSTANIFKFNPENHAFQQAFYRWAKLETTGEKYTCRIMVADKAQFFSRSRVYQYSDATLDHEMSRIVPLLEQWKKAHDTGLFLEAEDQSLSEDHDYYGYKGHGRQNKIIIH